MNISVVTLPLVRGSRTLNSWGEYIGQSVGGIRADIIVLPEYAWGRDVISSKDLEDIVQSWDMEATIVAGTAVMQVEGIITNSAIVVTKSKETALFPKSSPMHHERERGVVGMEKPEAIEIQGGKRLGVLICADLWHHSLVSTYIKQGIDILAVPTMSITLPNHGNYAKILWYSLTLTRSREFVLPIVVSDHPGNEKVTTGFASAVADPSRKSDNLNTIEDFLVLPDEQGNIRATLDLERIREYREYRIKEGLIAQEHIE